VGWGGGYYCTAPNDSSTADICLYVCSVCTPSKPIYNLNPVQ